LRVFIHGLVDLLQLLAGFSNEVIVGGKIIKSVKQFASGLSDIDDMTLVVMKARGRSDGFAS